MHAWVFVCYTNPPGQPHSYIPMVCIHMYDGKTYCVCKHTSTNMYCESERKYLSAVYVSSIVHSSNHVCCLIWVTGYNGYFYVGSTPPTPKQVAGCVHVGVFLSLLQ